MKTIILASESPRRKSLLESIGIEFKIHPSHIDEESVTAKDPQDLVKLLSKMKAEEVARHYKDAIIIAADTVVHADGKTMGKPKSKEDAIRMLTSFSGKNHRVITGCTILDTSSHKEYSMSDESIMMFRKLSDDIIKRYVESGEPMDKAGGYGYLGKGAILIEKMEGDYYSEVGLPLGFVIETLEKCGVTVINKYEY